jgi:AcrR family transcriptional regulator
MASRTKRTAPVRSTARRQAAKRPGAKRTGQASAGRRAQNKEVTRERIVTAALGLFQSKGFDATTTKEIARKAGIAEGTVFNYFTTKDDIALHFFEMEVDRAIETVRKKPRLRTAPLDEKLFALVEAQLAYLAPYESFIGSAFLEALKPSSPLGVFSHKASALRHRYLGFVQELLEESVPKKNLAPISWWAPDAFWVFYLVILLFWLNDASPRKQNTLAFLDRTLKIGVSIIKRTA